MPPSLTWRFFRFFDACLCFAAARDIGGQTKLRPLWRHYYINTDALIFVVDSSDLERIEEARDEMFHVLRDPSMDGCQTVLILLNKQVSSDCRDDEGLRRCTSSGS